MHILTKLLVILAAVLAMVLSGLTVGYVSNADRVIKENERLRNQVQVANTSAELLGAELSAVREAGERERSQLNSEIASQSTNIATLEQANAELLAERSQFAAAAARYEVQIAELGKVAERFVTVEEANRQVLEDLRRSEQNARRREIDLEARINDLEGQLDVATESNRTLQEQIALLQEELQRAARTGGLAGTRAGESTGIPAPSNFRARVINVTVDVNGEDLVGIDAGSSDGLAPNMRLIVTRNGQFLANVIVENVNINDAIGRADDLGRNRTIQPGDLVLASNI